MRASIASIVSAALMAVPTLVSAQKTVQEGITSVHYKAPPATPAGLYAASHTVVLVRVTGEQGMESVRAGHRIVTEIVGTILEVVKPSAQVGPIGAPIAFRVSGGQVDRGDHIERITDPSQLKFLAGHDYLVALT